MASRYDELLAAGTRVVAIDVDSPGQHAAMVDKLELPFPYLSDPDRTGAITAYDLADPNDARGIAIPALVLLDPSGEERFRFVSRDFAERLPEDDVVEAAKRLGLSATTQEPIEVGPLEPGERAMPLDGMPFYFRGGRFSALAMGLRHGHHDDSIKEDSKAFVDEMDRFFEAAQALRARKAGN